MCRLFFYFEFMRSKTPNKPFAMFICKQPPQHMGTLEINKTFQKNQTTRSYLAHASAALKKLGQRWRNFSDHLARSRK